MILLVKEKRESTRLSTLALFWVVKVRSLQNNNILDKPEDFANILSLKKNVSIINFGDGVRQVKVTDFYEA